MTTKDTSVIAVKYTTATDDSTTLYIESDYWQPYAKSLSNILKTILDSMSEWGVTSRAEFATLVVHDTLEYAVHPRILTTRPTSVHTLHLVDVDFGKVVLVDGETGLVKTRFSFDDYLARYHLTIG